MTAFAPSLELSEMPIDGSGTAPLTNSATAAAHATAPLSLAIIPQVGPSNCGLGGSGIVTGSSDAGLQLARTASAIAASMSPGPAAFERQLVLVAIVLLALLRVLGVLRHPAAIGWP